MVTIFQPESCSFKERLFIGEILDSRGAVLRLTVLLGFMEKSTGHGEHHRIVHQVLRGPAGNVTESLNNEQKLSQGRSNHAAQGGNSPESSGLHQSA